MNFLLLWQIVIMDRGEDGADEIEEIELRRGGR